MSLSFFQFFELLKLQSVPLYQCLVEHGIVGCNGQYHPIVVNFSICVVFALYSFVWSIVGQNCSKVDQIWSITPIVYAWHLYSCHEENGHPRLFVLSTLITLWGLRLTFNFWRRGGYGNLIHHEEDYRWPILRKMMNPAQFFIFNLTFIASYQNLLLWLITIPAFNVLKGRRDINNMDIGLVVIFLSFLVIETTADQQHYNFQEMKHALKPAERATHPSADVRDGFLRSGLFRYCRHPNYFAEQSIWVCVYLFSVMTPDSPDWLNWTGLGAVLLILLFQGSMAFSESITLSKYPNYKDYQRSTSQCIPFFPGRISQDKSE